MSQKSAFKLSIDLIMTILMMLALAFRITGDTAHEWIGLSFFLLFVVHNVLNFHWYKHLLKQRQNYSFKWVLNLIINCMLVVVMGTVVITGFMQSKVILSYFELQSGMVLRQIHTIASYWGYVLVSIHLGVHWQMIYKQLFGKLAKPTAIRLPRLGLQALGFTMALGGVWAFVQRDMYSKLFQAMTFDFWDKSTALFFAYQLLIMVLFVWITYYLLKTIPLVAKKK